ncbi:MAG: 50S ribosomal protein L11 [uncultured bacterium]|uniref:Large ribosomal subunit protein uL11 n=4 Tax=Candidatus Daviesiibacteriota TaxID=1752718 RepID=A0A0G0EQ46_9BACT|nr:MAG: 50S ribosomal protein L11 [uncultured bacterium]KKQ09068.1 MAG: 50S ribosomal protein L11 [Candidatus Daviesbacteria bacterium GW2011_GWB1_36_5]KKQ16104.1 MAG: 50S ribosomal protein L11 [Candidatus Daviesbacteria bacterium GW2011_GWA1_36_8]OGE17344.1 MAG: 50S ribosomal protein L11 [Candidatus Daviesbacteria bacterium RIFCSPHIGHO2_01_FULL_36_37]OGE32220.1 MAG: 50S ribosomal protein L11 [Candidatus Daviesbacteria bacterium RIFCSPHIGHO2_02_FULL_37_9]OGE36304.1 MAG: 50S ribosomal protein L
MAAKKIKTYIKLTIPAGTATAAPPVGTALGPHGLPIMDFVKAFNEKTKDKMGNVLPVVITVYEDRTFSFITKEPPIAEMIKKALNLEKGAGKAGHETAGTLSKKQVEDIASAKLPDLNTKNVAQASKIVAGVARSMGVKVAAN